MNNKEKYLNKILDAVVASSPVPKKIFSVYSLVSMPVVFNDDIYCVVGSIRE